jgi:hypothetical protein
MSLGSPSVTLGAPGTRPADHGEDRLMQRSSIERATPTAHDATARQLGKTGTRPHHPAAWLGGPIPEVSNQLAAVRTHERAPRTSGGEP